MLYRIIGPAGSGKTTALYHALQQAYEAGRPCIWIAPEQQSVQAERDILDRLGDGCNLLVEILNFERLPERIAREYGDLAVTYPDQGALCALLSVLTYENRRMLREYAACAEDGEFVRGLLGLFARLRSERIRPEALLQAVETGRLESERLTAKVADLARLYQAYDAYFDRTRRDPRDALTVLADQLETKPFFRGKTVFIDGYYTFTGQEYAVLAGILRQADDVYCSFTYDGRELFSAHEASAFRLAKYAGAGGCSDLPVGSYRRSQSDELRVLEQFLWADETPVFTGQTGAVRILCAETAFAEAEAVAAEILRLVRGGLRYREITVLARNIQSYAGILDVALQQNQIPFFLAEKEDLLTRPLLSFVCASLEVAVSDCSLPAVRRYLKSGYAGLSAEDCDLVLRYAESWRLRGRDWYGEEGWTRNPDGYRDGGLDEEQEALLAAVNRVREQLRPALRTLRETLRGKQPAKELLRVLYAHLERVGAAERFVAQVNAQLQRGETEAAARDSQIWELLMGMFERLEELCGETPTSPKRLLSLLQLMARQYALGSIPSSLDSVTVGEAALIRPDHAKAVIVMGCNDGVFPAAVGGDPLFDEQEAVQLEGAGFSIVEGRMARLQAERFYFYSAIAAPSQTLLLTYPTGTVSGETLRPSLAVLRVQALLPHVQTECYTGLGAQALFSAEHARAVFWSLPDGEERDRLHALLAEKGMQPPAVRESIFDPTARIAYQSQQLRVSPSGVERYRYCPFSYFGSAVMKLKEKKVNRFATQEIGTFLHKMLEEFLSMHTREGRFTPPPTRQALEAEAEQLAQAYFLAVAGGLSGKSKRFLHTYWNLKKTLLLLLQNLCDEFSASDFLPAGFEVSIGLPSADGRAAAWPAVEVPLPDGRTVYLCGSIDRVDRYEKDGVTYVRVVDYKTYGKELHLEYVREHGIDEQMLLYLYAYCHAAADGELLRPAGVLYNAVILPFAEARGGETEEEIREKLEQKLVRTGVILEDNEIAMAMDRSASGNYLPVRFDADGALKKGKGTLSAEGFEELWTLLETQLCELAEQVLGGHMDIRPLKLDPEHDACRYCTFRAACRYREPELEND